MLLPDRKLIKSVVKYLFPVFLTLFVSCKKSKEFFIVSEDPLISYSISDKNIVIFLENFNNDGEIGDLNDKATSLKENGASAKARSLLLKALELDTQDPVIYNNLGNIEYDEKNFDKAIEYFNKSIKFSDSLYFLAYYNLGKTYSLIGEEEKAEVILKLAENKTDNQFLKGLARYHLAVSYLEYGEVIKGSEALKKAESNLKEYQPLSFLIDKLKADFEAQYPIE